jgi:hypothetical protein
LAWKISKDALVKVFPMIYFLSKVNSKTYVTKNKAKKNHVQKFTFAHEAITSAASEKGSHQKSNLEKI